MEVREHLSKANLVDAGAQFCADIGHQLVSNGVTRDLKEQVGTDGLLDELGYRAMIGRLTRELSSVPRALDSYPIYDLAARESPDGGVDLDRVFDVRTLHVVALMLQLAGLQRLGNMEKQCAPPFGGVLLIALNHDAHRPVAMKSYETLFAASGTRGSQRVGSEVSVKAINANAYARQRYQAERIARVQHEAAVLSLIAAGLAPIDPDAYLKVTADVASELMGYAPRLTIWLAIFEEQRVRATMEVLGVSCGEARKLLADDSKIPQFNLGHEYRVA